MHPSKIMWNCRGFKINFNEISLLIHEFNPVAFSLQETHLKQSDNATLIPFIIATTQITIERKVDHQHALEITFYIEK
jgi:hypothetical protein